MKKVISTAIAVMLLAGCGSQSPLEKLKHNVVHEEINNVFWSKERDAKTPLWDKGLAYCREHEEKPNCDGLMLVFILGNGSQKLPGYGNSGDSLEIPDF